MTSCGIQVRTTSQEHADVIKWKHFQRYWPFVRGIYRSTVNSPHKGQRRGALMFSLICARINGWVNNGEAGELRRYRPHYDVTVMKCWRYLFLIWVCKLPWWRYQMEIFSALLALCAGNSLVTGEFPSKRPVTELWCFLWPAPEHVTNGRANNWDASDLRCHHAHHDVTVMTNTRFQSHLSGTNE